MRVSRIRPVSPPASYYPSFRRLYIQANVSSTQYFAVQRSALDGRSKHLFIMKPWGRLTAPRCPLVSKWSDDWPRRRLAKNRANCFHVTVWQAPFANTMCQTHENSRRERIDLTLRYPWLPCEINVVINITPKPCKWSSVSATIATRNSLWQFKTGVFTCSVTRVNFAPGPLWPVKRYQQALKQVIAKIST